MSLEGTRRNSYWTVSVNCDLVLTRFVRQCVSLAPHRECVSSSCARSHSPAAAHTQHTHSTAAEVNSCCDLLLECVPVTPCCVLCGLRLGAGWRQSFLWAATALTSQQSLYRIPTETHPPGVGGGHGLQQSPAPGPGRKQGFAALCCPEHELTEGCRS